MRETIIEFQAIRNDDKIAGYAYKEELDDENCILYYTSNGVENGTIIPHNPYSQEQNYEDWQNYELLKDSMFTDTQFLQFLYDFAEEHKEIEREDYILIIN